MLPFDHHTSQFLRKAEGSLTSATLCQHCGDRCGQGSVSFEGKPFCCSGCRSVYQILQQNDLCEYYSASDAGVSMRAQRAADDQYLILDDKRVQREQISFSSETRHRVTWTIPTLHCASCVWLLEQLHRLDGGVLLSTVDIMRKSVTVDYDPRSTNLRTVAETLASIGYAPLIRLEGETTRPHSTRGLYTRIGLAGFATVNTMLIAFAQYLAGPEGVDAVLRNAFNIVAAILSIPVLLYSASPWFTAARASLRQRRVSLDVPVAVGILALFIRSSVDIIGGRGEGYLDSFNALVFLLLIGRLFQQRAFDALSFNRSYRSFFPLSVRVFRNDEAEIIPIEAVRRGDLLIIRNGEVIPCDSTLESEAAYIDYSFVTGESAPIESVRSQLVHAGGKVIGNAVTLIARKEVAHSELAEMWDRTWKRASRKTFLTVSDTFGRWFTLVAIGVAVIGAMLWLPDWEMAFNVFTAVLIIACPCALTLSAPITLGTAMGKLGGLGIYLKNVGTLLELYRVNTVFFDKTGTLTYSTRHLEYYGRDLSEEQFAAIRAVASQSTHPVSRRIADGYCDTGATAVLEFIGKGVAGSSHGHYVLLGSREFVVDRVTGSERVLGKHGVTHVAIDGHYVGCFALKSALRSGVAEMIRALFRSGKRAQVVSGDSSIDAPILAPILGEDLLNFNCRPEDKIRQIESSQAQGDAVLMVGDGLNDAGAMSTADVAIAVTEDTATLVPACDVIMRSNSVKGIAALLDYAKKVKQVIVTCFIISVVYNILGLGLAVMGMLSPLVAAILMPVSSLTVIGVSVAGARLSIMKLQKTIEEESACS